MRILAIIIPEPVINALGWTIFHSLWQGMIVGLILLLIFKFRRDISPQARYLLGVFALAAIFISSLLTFFMAYHPASSPAEFVMNSSASISTLEGISERADGLSILNPALLGWQQSLVRTFDLVSITWFIGVLLFTLRLAGGMLVIRGMRKQQVSPLPACWEQRLQLLAAKSGMKRAITFLLSQKVRVPTVIGILRPVVLIPAMIISGLPADQLESIIIHELAHIRRHDFLINIMQSIMEALFFYHPVVWIISENIRLEREKCCDDYSVKVCGQVSLYARALACLSELQITAGIPSLAFTGNKKNIVHRVERLINSKKMKTNRSEKLMAGLVLMTSVLIITLSTGATFKPAGFAQMESQIVLPYMDKEAFDTVAFPEPVAEPAAENPVNPSVLAEEPAESAEAAEVLLPEPISIPDPISLPAKLSLPSPASLPAPVALPDTSGQNDHVSMDIKDNTVTRDFHNKDGKDHEMKFVIRQGTVEELFVDGKKIPKNEFSRYQKEIDVTLEDLRDMERDLKHARVELDQVDFDKIREEMMVEMEHFKQHEMKDLQEEMQKLQEQQIKIHMDKEALKAEIEQAMKDVQIDQKKLQEEMFKAQEEFKKAMEEFQYGKQEFSEEEFKQAMKEMERGLAEAEKGMAMLDKEEMQKIMDEALKSVQEIERDMHAAKQYMEQEKFELDKERKNIDEMIEELEKLELQEK
jgi:bla regulator protein BlaR1